MGPEDHDKIEYHVRGTCSRTVIVNEKRDVPYEKEVVFVLMVI